MNERIRELADQARFTDRSDYPSQDEVFTKFANLLIKECLDKLVDEMDSNGMDFSCNTKWYRVMSSVEKHFGVEYE